MNETNETKHDYACALRQNPEGFRALDAFARGLVLANAQSADFVGCAAHGLRQQIWDRDDELHSLRLKLSEVEMQLRETQQSAQSTLKAGTSVWNAVRRVAELLGVENHWNEVWEQSFLDNDIQSAIMGLKNGKS